MAARRVRLGGSAQVSRTSSDRLEAKTRAPWGRRVRSVRPRGGRGQVAEDGGIVARRSSLLPIRQWRYPVAVA